MPKKKMVQTTTMGAAGGGLGGRANLGLGSLRGAGNGAERGRRMDAYLGAVTGEKPKPKKKGR
jgi:hypothetical protein